MSFGFSLSDFALCAQLCHNIYRALKEAPRECEAFALEILHLHNLLKVLAADIANVSAKPNGLVDLAKRQPNLSLYGAQCIELLIADIAGYSDSWSQLHRFHEHDSFRVPRASALEGFEFAVTALSTLKQRLSQAKFSRKIPRLRQDVANILSKLSAENVQIVRLQQEKASESQARIEITQTHLESKIADSHSFLERSQELNVSAASALQDSQIRIEQQLQQILQVQSRQANPVLSGSLDASSPEGRQTWMELGRLLREEGITPNVISKNKGLLIQAMKKSIQNLSDSPDAASYKTAVEHQSCSSSVNMSLRPSSSLENSMNLLSSAPCLGATFSEDFLARSAPSPRLQSCLEQEENLEGGMRSLIGGMAEIDHAETMSDEPSQEMDLEELADCGRTCLERTKPPHPNKSDDAISLYQKQTVRWSKIIESAVGDSSSREYYKML